MHASPDPETSHDAATANVEGRVTDRERALAVLREYGPLTDFQLAELTGRQATSIGKRRKELCDLGMCEYAGFTRPAPSGASARVWRAR